jgi:thioredoxin-dependent peroxiredoxin
MTLAVGDRAPDFTLPGSNQGTVTLSELTAGKTPGSAGGRTVVIFFYPKDDTPGCTIEACGFRDEYYAFAQAGAEVIGISSDSVVSHDRFAQKHKLPMTLLSDADGKVRELYGVRASLGIMPGRATFVVDREGFVRHTFVSQLRFARHVKEALEVVRRLEREREKPDQP